MSDSHVEGDTRYLFKRDKTWWVKVAVPRTLRDELGYDLRRSLQTHDLEAARESRWAEADGSLQRALRFARVQFPSAEDPDLRRVVDMAEEFRGVLRRYVGRFRDG